MLSGVTILQFEDFRIITCSIIYSIVLNFPIFKGTVPLFYKIECIYVRYKINV